MSSTVVHLERARYREAARLLARAFRNDPVAVAILKGLTPENRIRIMALSLAADLQMCGPGGYPLAAVEDDTLAGAAIIHRPGAYPLPLPVQFRLLGKVLAGGLTTPGALASFGRWLRWLSAIAGKHPREPHFYLEFIGVDVPFQGNGLGSRMLERLAGEADEARVGSFLETGNSRDVALFRRFGFETTATQEILGVPVWFMWRPSIR